MKDRQTSWLEFIL